MPKLYSQQFKADAVALVNPGIARRQVCADWGGHVPLCKSGSMRLAWMPMG
ncbi:transposase-like protein [Canibacter oris]|uniref:Transposase-like protein n=1 Tax=Canibacter oris TaxID=1365628 RepID=A0A840DMW7_9MICO|nr:transposase-like protein [Canibacter oris]